MILALVYGISDFAGAVALSIPQMLEQGTAIRRVAVQLRPCHLAPLSPTEAQYILRRTTLDSAVG